MYLAHYHLKVKPFQISPDPKFLWLGETHRDVLSTLKYSLLENRGFLLLVGDVGTGKTTLVNRLLENLDAKTIVATVQYPGFEILDFYNFLSTSFDMGRRFATKGDFLVRFIHFLHKMHTEKRKVLLILDEAQGLSNEILEEIRLLSNIEKMNKKLLSIFLVGQNEVEQLLDEPANQALAQRITTRCYLGPILKKEVKEYIRFRLRVAGTEEPLFTAGAIREIIIHSDCCPRMINVICDCALLAGYIQGLQKIDAGIIRECAESHQIQVVGAQSPDHMDHGNRKKKGRLRVWAGKQNVWALPLILVFFLLVLIVAGYNSYLDDGEKVSPPEVQLNPKTGSSSIAHSKKEEAEAGAFVNREKSKRNASAIDKPDKINREVTAKVEEEDIGPEKQSSGKKQTGVLKKKTARSDPVLEPASNTRDGNPEVPPDSDPGDKLTIHFEAYSETISEEVTADLHQFLLRALKYPQALILIKGYTDSSGKMKDNKRLSTVRAEKIKNYFVDKGFSPDKIKAIGLGEKDPVASNRTLEGRNANRRIEIELIHD